MIARSRSATLAVVVDTIRRLLIDRDAAANRPSIEAGTRLEEDLGLYSLERLELGMRLRDHPLPVEPASVVGATSVGDVVALAHGEPCARPAAETFTFPPDPIWRPPGTPPRSLPFTAAAAALLAGVSLGGRVLIHRRRGSDARGVLRQAARTLGRLVRARIAVDGLSHFEGAGPVVVVANHQSYIDTIVLLATLPIDACFVANEGLPSTPLLGAAIAAADHLVVNRAATADPQAAVRRMIETLEAGVSLVVFPEGTIAPGPGLLPFRMGAFAAAAAAGRPIVPVTIAGTRRMLPFDTWQMAPVPLAVHVHAPIEPAGRTWRDMTALAARARAAVESRSSF